MSNCSSISLMKLTSKKGSSLFPQRWLGCHLYVCRNFSRSTPCYRAASKKYDVLIIGCGSGGAAVASRKFGRSSLKVAIMDAAKHHYYQPMWSLVGSNLKEFDDTGKPMEEIIPKGVEWIQDNADMFNPDTNTVTTGNGDIFEYNYLIIGTGLQLDYDKVDGLTEALAKTPQVCSNYSAKWVKKTWPCMKSFAKGNAIFTFPNTPIKCAGAPQKIMYLTEWRFKEMGKRDQANFKYVTALPVVFGIPKYATALNSICDERGIERIFRHDLVKIDPGRCKATFKSLDEPDKEIILDYEMLHVTPPMGATDVMKRAKKLVDEAGYVKVDISTLQHQTYPNIFAIGDCAALPTSKTAAAAAAQSGIVRRNLIAVMNGQKPTEKYDGYTSCPLLTGYDQVMMAEFGYDGVVLETFPFDQSIPRYSMFYVKKNLLPPIYWQGMLRGYWEGPASFRKVFSLVKRA